MKIRYNEMTIWAMLPVVLIMAFALLLAPITAQAQTSCGGALQDEIDGYRSAASDMVITIDLNCAITANLTIPANTSGATLTIRSANPQSPVTLKRGVDRYLFTVNSGAKLIFEDIIIDGNNDAYMSINSYSYSQALVYVNGGEFTMNGGAVLANNVVSYDGGGGVRVESGTFIMNGGEITGNTASRDGGGVYVERLGTFIMSGGKITNNTASFPNYSSDGGGVFSRGTFAMSGGEITGNTASNGNGGGVNASYGTFIMSGGEITDNTALHNGGGGVYFSPSGTFTMTGGKITGNRVLGFSGAGVRAPDEFTIGGTAVISGNMRSNVIPGGYITLSTDTPPVPGMNIGVTMANGVIVSSGASAGDEAYFHADRSGRMVTYLNNRLFIIDDGPFVDFYHQVALYAFADDDTTITVDRDMVLTYTVIPANKNGATLTIRSANPQKPATMTRGSIGGLFSINRGVKLILEDIIIDGNSSLYVSNGGSLVTINGGEFTMKGGAVLTNNRAANGGGVFVYSGIFTMNGGEITDNTASNLGGGVRIQGGTFIMTGGKIAGNIASSSAYGDGGGVQVSSSTFIMSGGEITGNTASDGGGVYVSYSGTFTMNGGEITDNTAFNKGGGVYVLWFSNTFTMNGGEIAGNTASFGGGVFVPTSSSPSIFIMSGGKITSNIASSGGGVFFEPSNVNNSTLTRAFKRLLRGVGVYVNRKPRVFTLGGTAVINNNAKNNVYLAKGGYIRLSTDIPPVAGMNISVQTTAPGGFIVNSGASAETAEYFHADEPEKFVVFTKKRLVIKFRPAR